jgi:hypothetical protein
MRALSLAATAMLPLLAACGTDPGACTLRIEPAITVRAVDAVTGQNVTDGAQGAVSERNYADSLRPARFDMAHRVQLLRAADERPGTYDMFGERLGYQSVSLSAIEVTAGECHVNTVAVRRRRLDGGGPPLSTGACAPPAAHGMLGGVAPRSECRTGALCRARASAGADCAARTSREPPVCA